MKELLDIQQKLHAPKDETATVPTKNGKMSYNYRTAEGIIEAVKPLLAENKCTLVCNVKPVLVGERNYLLCSATITNEAGESVTSESPAWEAQCGGMSTAQSSGAAITYAKRYALCCLFAIDDSSDDPDVTDGPSVRAFNYLTMAENKQTLDYYLQYYQVPNVSNLTPQQLASIYEALKANNYIKD